MLGIGRRDYELTRLPPPSGLEHLVERCWTVTWEVPAGRPASATVLPHPCVNLVLDAGRLHVGGVMRELFTYHLVGRGAVFGVKFRPGGFRPFLGGPVADLTDRVSPLAELWGPQVAALEGALAAAASTQERIEAAGAFLRARQPPADANVELVGRIVRALLADRSVGRVEDVTARFGLTTRSLQRLFREYVGVPPKWVLQRYRLHEAAARLADGPAGGWASVAAELGYFDQSHFIRHFTRAIGLTPTAYADACREDRAPLAT